MKSQLPVWEPPATDPKHPLFDAPPTFVHDSQPVQQWSNARIAPEIAAEIRRLFKINGMTKLAISQKLKISRSTVIRYLGTH